MKRMNHWVLAATLVSGLSLTGISCSNEDNGVTPSESGQLLEVYGVQGSQGKADGRGRCQDSCRHTPSAECLWH